MDENNFLMVADATLQSIFDQLEDHLGDKLDSDLDSGVLTISLESGAEYVINRHLPNREIWMSSPVSGGTHFKYDADSGKWQSIRDSKVMLRDTLQKEICQLLDVKFFFES